VKCPRHHLSSACNCDPSPPCQKTSDCEVLHERDQTGLNVRLERLPYEIHGFPSIHMSLFQGYSFPQIPLTHPAASMPFMSSPFTNHAQQRDSFLDSPAYKPNSAPTLRLFYNILQNLQLPHPLPTSSAYIINHPHPSSIHCSNIFHNHTNQLLHLKDQSSTHSQAHQGIASNWYLFSFHTCTQIPSTSIFSTHFKHI